MKLLTGLHLTRFFFLVAGIGIVLTGGAFFVPFLGVIGKTILFVLLFALVLDVLLVNLFKEPVRVQRRYLQHMNLGDENKVVVSILNQTAQPLQVSIYEGYPLFMQKRSQAWNAVLLPKKVKNFPYSFIPTERGEYEFRDVVIFVRSALFLAQRRIVIPLVEKVEVYPSVLQMKQYELKVFNQQTVSQGIKKVRRIGNTSEFEQIRNYVQGDDIRTVNWKATSRKNELMVNQYQEERSQPVYCIIDKSRPMQLAFNKMTMLDYAVNSTLVFTNIALRKGDRAGLITFSDKMGSIIPAERNQGQLKRILESLFNQKTLFREANFELLYQTIRKQVKTRSLLLLYTNFESEFAMRRALPMLQRLNKRHVLIVIFFQNNELQELAQQPVHTHKELIEATIADKMSNVKWNITRELRRNGIQAILSKPEDLSINSINKYLELKAKGVI
ncbi:DUF58 domain-containing protein [Fluviicola sp.]|jgi:uncharacterized protein (DUF58 family)|uniref:DUF58 domain-containing protein n=1 Tax=Fluviicola sp. TaxID=1917219 RepID=UPI00283523C7|nr:DUF58 domain-containing protein [Fluviicola sp.]MDR0802649.1 DUF58 domain-containing protein [Fluviicola sp.]